MLLCDGVDSYHPAARRLLGRILADLLAEPAFIPLLSAAEGDVPTELAALKQGGPGALLAYLRNVRLGLYQKAERVFMEARE